MIAPTRTSAAGPIEQPIGWPGSCRIPVRSDRIHAVVRDVWVAERQRAPGIPLACYWGLADARPPATQTSRLPDESGHYERLIIRRCAIFDHELRLESCDFGGQTSRFDAGEHVLEVLIGIGRFITRVLAAVAHHIVLE